LNKSRTSIIIQKSVGGIRIQFTNLTSHVWKEGLSREVNGIRLGSRPLQD